MSILERISSQQNLSLVWKEMWKLRSRRNSNSPGVDGETLDQFQNDAQTNIAQLSQRLKAGYTFSDLRAAPVPKENSEDYRIICVPTVRDRIVQRAVGEELQKRFYRYGINNPASFGFLRSSEKAKKGVKPAIEELCRLRQLHGWAFKSDIEKYFDRINREELISRLVKTVRATSLHELLIGAVNCEIRLERGFIHRKVKEAGIKAGEGVRQGMPLSPVFANFQLANFDRQMLASNYCLIRYADDFVILAKNKAECEKAGERARQLLIQIGHTLPPLTAGSKTKICGPESSLDFLGYQVRKVGSKYAPFASDAKIMKMEGDILDMADINTLVRSGRNFTNFGQSLDAKAKGYVAAFRLAHNCEELASRVDASTKVARERVLASLFGSEQLQRLSAGQRNFLGI
ncbi:MAG: reverse transcriptase domain-containing protein [Parvularculaceae bacterium]